MKKNFAKWNGIKEKVDTLDVNNFYFKEQDIWWSYYGANVGSEQDGKGREFLRPVLIFKKFSKTTCWVIPLSLKVRNGTYYFPLLSKSNTFRIAILTQMKMVDAKRLIKKIDSISMQEFNFVKEKITALIQ